MNMRKKRVLFWPPPPPLRTIVAGRVWLMVATLGDVPPAMLFFLTLIGFSIRQESLARHYHNLDMVAMKRMTLRTTTAAAAAEPVISNKLV